jgi:hypothetical protein
LAASTLVSFVNVVVGSLNKPSTSVLLPAQRIDVDWFFASGQTRIGQGISEGVA